MRCDFCSDYNMDNCASWKMRLTEYSNYCENYINTDLDYRFSEGEDKWSEMSYNVFIENELDCMEDDWDLYLEEVKE